MEVGPDQDHAIDEIRAAHRNEESDDPAVAPSDDVSASTDDLLEHADRLGRHVVVVERLVGVGGATMAATVEGHDAVVLSESVREGFERVAVRQAGMHHQDRLIARSALVNPRRMAVDLDSFAHLANPMAPRVSL